MRKHPHSQSRRIDPRIFAAVGLCLMGTWLAMLSLAAPMPASFRTRSEIWDRTILSRRSIPRSEFIARREQRWQLLPSTVYGPGPEPEHHAIRITAAIRR